jgi:hypothetical protein
MLLKAFRMRLVVDVMVDSDFPDDTASASLALPVSPSSLEPVESKAFSWDDEIVERKLAIVLLIGWDMGALG